MSPELDCPICALAKGQPAARIATEDGLFVAPARHLGAWAELNATEQFAALSMISGALQENASVLRSDVVHGHFVLRLGDHTGKAAERPGLLIAGGEDPLLPHLARNIDRADAVDMAIAFALDGGVNLIFPWLEDLLGRGGFLRVVVGDYLDVTEPSALRRLLDLGQEGLRGRFEPYVFETNGSSFHPKAWLFRTGETDGATIVGSSNLTRLALTDGVEWNLYSEAPQDRQAVLASFEILLSRPNVRPLTNSWIDAYAARRQSRPLPSFAAGTAAIEPSRDAPLPHGVQVEALAALDAARRSGHQAGLVVLATGLGKTWLSAFDSRGFNRVLFVAHREEILAQAMSTYRQIRPGARFGHYSGTAKEAGEIVFASIQTLGRAEHLRRFDPNDFDYIVVDEFHHAAAASYRHLLDHFTPRFLLGLTATPERTDGGDLLSLCGENLVFRCDLYDGITRGLLAPFHYFGVPDEVDYEQIPWRSTRFDEEALTTAVATRARADNALEQLRIHGNGPAIGFCVSRRHADFMAAHFQAAGLRAAAVHSGEGSAPRTSSLEALRSGELDILFTVDMFNEGVDVPNIGTVLMLRPTESTILFLQQLGRGLRRFGDKVLRVIDYIGNHRVFLTKARALLAAGDGDRSLIQKLEAAASGELSLPPGCEVTYDLKALDMLRAMLRQRSGSDEGEAWYLDFRERMGERPTAAEFAHAGFDPARTGHGDWFDFVRDMADAVPDALEVHRTLLQRVERAEFSDAGALLVLQALLPSLSRGEATSVLHARAGLHATRRGFHAFDPNALSAGWTYWAETPDFRVEDDRLRMRRVEAVGLRDLLTELIEWRLAAYLGEPESVKDGTLPPNHHISPTMWQEYMREEIPPLFGTTFNPGNWNSGIVSQGNDLILLTTLKKGSLASGNHYDDRFLSPTRLQWQSQSQTRQDSRHGRILSDKVPEHRVHLFVRSEKLRGSKAAPFLYVGVPRFAGWHGDKPITIEWELSEPVPERFRRMLQVP
jgi:superfamily II DNA or RNA helicase/HKD family nuclease